MASSDAALVKATGLTRDFGAQRAVDDVSFTIAGGEVVGILGPNGAGKTTTLRMLAGLLTPTAGNAELCGIDVAKDPLEARKHLGFMTASTGLHEKLTPREVLETFGALHGLSTETIAQRTRALAEELDLTPFLDKRCSTLSSGQKQRAGIARALVADPSVVVLDEPTAALDPLASDAILTLVKQSQARGRAVLFSTHRMEEAEYLCQRLLFMREGKVVAEGSPIALREQSGQPTLTGAFLHYARARA
jgi:sodium transport system ATP-binding protein